MAAADSFSGGVPDLISQYVVYFYRHIRYNQEGLILPLICGSVERDACAGSAGQGRRLHDPDI